MRATKLFFHRLDAVGRSTLLDDRCAARGPNEGVKVVLRHALIVGGKIVVVHRVLDETALPFGPGLFELVEVSLGSQRGMPEAFLQRKFGQASNRAKPAMPRFGFPKRHGVFMERFLIRPIVFTASAEALKKIGTA